MGLSGRKVTPKNMGETNLYQIKQNTIRRNHVYTLGGIRHWLQKLPKNTGIFANLSKQDRIQLEQNEREERPQQGI